MALLITALIRTAANDTIPSFDKIDVGIILETDFSFAFSTAHSPLPSFQNGFPLIAEMVLNIPPNAVVIDLGGDPSLMSVIPDSCSIPSTLEILTSIS